jgi:hypothetical protein
MKEVRKVSIDMCLLLSTWNILMSKIWIELGVISPYDNYQIIAHRLDSGAIGVLKNGALTKAERIVDLYDYGGTNYSDICGDGEVEIDDKDFVPIDDLPVFEN